MKVMLRAIGVGVALLSAGMLAGCAHQGESQYVWGDYAPALYRHYSDNDDKNSLAIKLSEIIAAGEPASKVPPGIYAEYGYVLLTQGKSGEAISFFEKEKLHYPESRFFMDKMIAAAKTDQPKSKADGANAAKQSDAIEPTTVKEVKNGQGN